MKLKYRVVSRLWVALLVLLGLWSSVFYYIIVGEINDETDDSLEEYSEYIITRSLAGEDLPSADNGTNNSYHIREVAAEYAAQVHWVKYFDEEVYIESMRETEPARVLRTVFQDADGKYYELSVMIPTFEKADLQETILRWVVLLYVVLLLTILVLNARIISRSFRPLNTLLDWLDGITLGGGIPPFKNDTKVTEFRRLNEAVLRSTRRNHEVYEEQRSFIGDASHEMQTPIAVCMNRLEMLASDPALTEEQMEEVLKTRQALGRLSDLNRTLLLLTRIENRQFPESSQVDVNRIVKSIAVDYSEIYTVRGITVKTTEQALLRVTMNDSLASVLLGNLIKNAFIHSPEGGSIEIVISPKAVSISNTADNGPLDEKLIFRRFWQGAKKTGAAGLGLSLCESICRHYEMRIVYDFHDGRHRFTVHTAP